MKLKRYGSADAFEIHVSIDPEAGFHWDVTTTDLVHIIHFTIGTKYFPPIQPNLFTEILDKIPGAVTKIIIPEYIPAVASNMIAALLSLGRDVEITEGSVTMPQERPPMHVESLNSLPEGFTPLTEGTGSMSAQDGFVPLMEEESEEEDEDHPDIEKREMWVEDPDRMNRLSYASIGLARGEHTYPVELGGGRITGGVPT